MKEMRSECECQVEARPTATPLFRRNIGKIDRAIRLIIGSLLLAAGLFVRLGGYGEGLLFIILGAINLATGITRFCPLYIPFIWAARLRASRLSSSTPGGSN